MVYVLLMALHRLNTPHLVAMAADVASGLSYLAAIGHVHRDVAARNCIVTQSLSVKITGDSSCSSC